MPWPVASADSLAAAGETGLAEATGQGIVSVAADQGLVADVAVERIVAQPTAQRIVVRPARRSSCPLPPSRVSREAAAQQIIAVSAEQRIVAVIADQRVGLGAPSSTSLPESPRSTSLPRRTTGDRLIYFADRDVLENGTVRNFSNAKPLVHADLPWLSLIATAVCGHLSWRSRPPNPGFEDDEPGRVPSVGRPRRQLDAGYRMSITDSPQAGQRCALTNARRPRSRALSATSCSVFLQRRFAASEFGCERRSRRTFEVRAISSDVVRVDRPSKTISRRLPFDNMDDRPIMRTNGGTTTSSLMWPKMLSP